jgi:hypothetical protein
MADLRAQFRPEFLNRIDDVVMFTPLTLPGLSRSSTCRSPMSAAASPTAA